MAYTSRQLTPLTFVGWCICYENMTKTPFVHNLFIYSPHRLGLSALSIPHFTFHLPHSSHSTVLSEKSQNPLVIMVFKQSSIALFGHLVTFG